jgi:hypothetical protein
MTDVTQILSEIERGAPAAAKRLLPLVYDELRKLAAAKLAKQKPGQTLQATALVHEAYLRLVGNQPSQQWDNRWHFFRHSRRGYAARITLNRAGRYGEGFTRVITAYAYNRSLTSCPTRRV